MPTIANMPTQLDLQQIDDVLSQRDLALDPAGYFIVYVDEAQQLICAKHYTTIIDDRGVALDPETGKPLPAKTKVERTESILYAGKTAKALCVEIFEKNSQSASPVSLMDHAAYLGREFMRAEYAMLTGVPYIQD